MADQIKYWHVTYNDIHNLIRKVTPQIAKEFNPDLLIAIGGGGFFPARVMRTFLREQTANKTLQIQAIGLSLYEPVEGATAEQLGNEVIRTQWLGADAGKMLIGKNNLIVDEVDDTRKTLHYALSELQKDVEAELLNYPESEREALRSKTKFAIFVVHNKLKPKLAELPADTPYFAGHNVEDLWLNYPWEAIAIEEHDARAAADKSSL
ncbi:Hypoxanthine-guanine phosphoribosyltransferase [Psilocybe cubensis]|uniref:Hypoxanthine-guanine phosphoribosyltransferase n=2 Tax=Psilocybe cubensis TaxID=181762 RepID=A0ACB8GVX1_PSICU|nr:Hypoxanthine-guanine phosphoribosyltransferase [Psilocybe cubensis]KAH9479587.1 Hypoxanthine-guanine phosphoribosyltransferase [Psilocybe cubensis]